MSVKEIARVMDAGLSVWPGDKYTKGVSIDSRTINPGELFFALPGDQYDGHDFASLAAANGALALVLSRPVAGIPEDMPVLMVPDTLRALQKLAHYNRGLSKIPVIGITGSNGKTTTKDMIASILGVRYRVLKNRGNFNNEIGLPLTLLAIGPEHDLAVVEMGMRGPGEINELCQIADINGAVITTIGETHIELLGSVDKIAKAKGEILEHVPQEGFAILNGNDPFIRREARRNKGRTVFFSLTGSADLSVESYRLIGRSSHFILRTKLGKVEINLPLPGLHNISNALAAAGVGICMGLSLEEIKKGLAVLEHSPMRMEFIDLNCITVVNDTYNASPTSTKAALDVLIGESRGSKRTVAVLGDMLELGEIGEAAHFEVGEHLVSKRIDLLFTFGKLAEYIAKGAVAKGMDTLQIFCHTSKEQLLKALGEKISKGDIILVKGSRGMRMEDVVEYLVTKEDLGAHGRGTAGV